MLDMIIRMLDAMPETASYEYDEEEKSLEVTGEDFDGFDENWSELDNEDFDEEKWDEFIRFLKDNCKESIDDYYARYVFDNFYVEIGYSSYEI